VLKLASDRCFPPVYRKKGGMCKFRGSLQGACDAGCGGRLVIGCRLRFKRVLAWWGLWFEGVLV